MRDGAVLSLYISRLTKIINQRSKLKSSLIFDEFPTIYFNGIDSLIATARSNKVATTIGMGNVISGQVSGETAKFLSEKFGRIMQDEKAFPSIAMILR